MTSLQTMELGSSRIVAEGDVSGFIVGGSVTLSNVETPQQFKVESVDVENNRMILVRTEPTVPINLDIEGEKADVDEDKSLKEPRDKRGVPIS